MKKILMIVLMAGALLSCGKNEVKTAMSIKNNQISLYRDKTEKIVVENAVGNVTYSSENKLIADVSDEGIVKGRVKGITKIKVTAGEESSICNVEVKTLIDFIPDPYLGFGESYETVKNKIKSDGEVIETNGGFGVFREIDGTKFLYSYLFENGKLTVSGFMLSISSKTTTSVIDFLLERYVVVKQTGTYQYALLSPDKKTAVFVSLSDNSNVMMVMYMPFTPTKSSAANYDALINNFKDSMIGLH